MSLNKASHSLIPFPDARIISLTRLSDYYAQKGGLDARQIL